MKTQIHAKSFIKCVLLHLLNLGEIFEDKSLRYLTKLISLMSVDINNVSHKFISLIVQKNKERCFMIQSNTCRRVFRGRSLIT